MTIDFEGSIQVEAIRAEQNPLKKFREYFKYLKEKFRSVNGTIIGIECDNLGDKELNLYKNFISFLRSVDSSNCDADDILNKCNNFFEETRNCTEPMFVDWMKNEISAIHFNLKNATWEPNSKNKLGLKEVFNYVLENSDPEKMF